MTKKKNYRQTEINPDFLHYQTTTASGNINEYINLPHIIITNAQILDNISSTFAIHITPKGLTLIETKNKNPNLEKVAKWNKKPGFKVPASNRLIDRRNGGAFQFFNLQPFSPAPERFIQKHQNTKRIDSTILFIIDTTLLHFIEHRAWATPATNHKKTATAAAPNTSSGFVKHRPISTHTAVKHLY